MSTDLLRALQGPLLEDIPGLELTPNGLRAQLELDYGLVPLEIDHDPEAEALRVSVRTPSPVGAGPDFLIWCLALNAQYWDAKIALDEGGMLLVHADLDASPGTSLEQLRSALGARVDTIAELIDDDLRSYLRERRLGTPEQLARWNGRS
jgi:hypothetical protein